MGVYHALSSNKFGCSIRPFEADTVKQNTADELLMPGYEAMTQTPLWIELL